MWFCNPLQELAQADAVERHRAREKESVGFLWDDTSYSLCIGSYIYIYLPIYTCICIGWSFFCHILHSLCLARNERERKWSSLQSVMKCIRSGFMQSASSARLRHQGRASLPKIYCDRYTTLFSTKQLFVSAKEERERKERKGMEETCFELAFGELSPRVPGYWVHSFFWIS